jgi:TRAP-type C4-dicarboxylate transport system permease small subunit
MELFSSGLGRQVQRQYVDTFSKFSLGRTVDAQKIVAIVLLIAGALGLAYGGFSYTTETHHADVGSVHLSLDETRHVNIPMWAGIGCIVIGGALLVIGKKA